jgi:hypothetical protein
VIEGILNRGTLGLIGLSIFLILLGVIGFFSRSNEELLFENRVINIPPPKNSFQQLSEAYESIGNPAFSITLAPLRVELPKLADQLLYFGKNTRPDVGESDSLIHIGLKTFSVTGIIAGIELGKPLYLTYLESGGTAGKEGQFEFSPSNKQTGLWVVFETEAEGQIKGKSFLRDEAGNMITTPEENHTFVLEEKPMNRFTGRGWELGGNRVDSALLARQKGRWFGQDKFLEIHGGESYAYALGREKIDIGEAPASYSFYLKEGEYVVWTEEKWSTPKKGANTQSLPLLQLIKVDPRVLKFDLWGPDGRAKISLSLPRSRSLLPTRGFATEFRLIGARTHKQAIVEINKNRTILKQDDWLVLSETEGWKKITTSKEVDDYVSQSTKAMMMVIDSMEKREGEFVVKGHIFTPSRADVKYFEMSTAKEEMIFLGESEEENKVIKPDIPKTSLPERRIQRTEEAPKIDRIPRPSTNETIQPKLDATDDENE